MIKKIYTIKIMLDNYLSLIKYFFYIFYKIFINILIQKKLELFLLIKNLMP